MEQDRRKQVMTELNELDELIRERRALEGVVHGPALEHVQDLRKLVEQAPPDTGAAHASARDLEQRLLAWELEHPRLVAIASRVAHALEDAGL